MVSSGLAVSCVWLELAALRTSEHQFLISREIHVFQNLVKDIPSITSEVSAH